MRMRGAETMVMAEINVYGSITVPVVEALSVHEKLI